MALFYDLVFYDHGQVSHTKFWSNIGYLLMCSAFVTITLVMLFSYTVFPTGDWVEIFAAFGAIVAIPRGFSKWVAYKTKSIAADKAIAEVKLCCKTKVSPDGEQELMEDNK
jgi:hypothetical protein